MIYVNRFILYKYRMLDGVPNNPSYFVGFLNIFGFLKRGKTSLIYLDRASKTKHQIIALSQPIILLFILVHLSFSLNSLCGHQSFHVLENVT